MSRAIDTGLREVGLLPDPPHGRGHLIKKSLLTQSQAVRNIDKLPDNVMSPEQKRQVIDGIFYGMARTAQLGNTDVEAG